MRPHLVQRTTSRSRPCRRCPVTNTAARSPHRLQPSVRRSVAGSASTSEQSSLNELADDVSDEDVALLYARCRIRRNPNENIDLWKAASGPSGQGQSSQPTASRDAQPLDDVLGVPAGGDSPSGITGASEPFELLAEDVAIRVIVRDGATYR